MCSRRVDIPVESLVQLRAEIGNQPDRHSSRPRCSSLGSSRGPTAGRPQDSVSGGALCADATAGGSRRREFARAAWRFASQPCESGLSAVSGRRSCPGSWQPGPSPSARLAAAALLAIAQFHRPIRGDAHLVAAVCRLDVSSARMWIVGRRVLCPRS